jgi:hypothetical protein
VDFGMKRGERLPEGTFKLHGEAVVHMDNTVPTQQ